MAVEAIKLAYLALSGPGDMSNRCNKIELAMDVDEQEATTFGSAGWKEVVPGLRSYQLSVSLRNDYADDALDEDMWSIEATNVSWIGKPFNSSGATTNPAYYGTVLVKGWKPLSAGVGEVPNVDLTWTGSGALNRTTTSAY